MYTDADIDEILAELNASSAGSVSLLEPASRANREIARILAGSGLTSIRLACPTEHGETVELTLVDGVWKRGDRA